MVKVETAERTQEKLEDKLRQRMKLVRSGKMNKEEAFGDINEWTLQIGEHRLLLVPSVQQWIYLDRLHDTLEKTDFGIGEVIFGASGNILGAKKRSQETFKHIFCEECGRRIPVGSIYCLHCGDKQRVAKE
jgi:hypothetical protein